MVEWPDIEMPPINLYNVPRISKVPEEVDNADSEEEFDEDVDAG